MCGIPAEAEAAGLPGYRKPLKVQRASPEFLTVIPSCESCLTVGDSTGISFLAQFLPSGADPAGAGCCPPPRRGLVMAEH